VGLQKGFDAALQQGVGVGMGMGMAEETACCGEFCRYGYEKLNLIRCMLRCAQCARLLEKCQ
jgi:hypothetical protein